MCAVLLAAVTPAGPAAARPAAGPPLQRPAAAATCPASAPAASAQIPGVPWAQERYPPQRLSTLATGRGVLVAVIDSGVDANHPQLTGSVVPGRDLLDGGAGMLDCVTHGTPVASIIAARPVPGVAFQGLAPQAQILPLRVSEQEQQVIDGETKGRATSAAGLADAIRYAVAHGADVLNLSIVLYRDEPAVRAAISDAVSAGVVVVAAVGNLHEKGDPTPYPAAYDGVLGVGAIGPEGTRLPNSQVGSYVDIMAPGAGITAAARVRGHGTYNGTSFAAPFVSATAALIRQYRPSETATETVRRILATADPAPGGQAGAEYGHGVLNPYRALVENVATDALAGPAPRPGLAERPAPTATDNPRADSRGRALGLAAALGILVLAALAIASAVPHGRRRRWRPGESGPGHGIAVSGSWPGELARGPAATPGPLP